MLLNIEVDKLGCWRGGLNYAYVEFYYSLLVTCFNFAQVVSSDARAERTWMSNPVALTPSLQSLWYSTWRPLSLRMVLLQLLLNRCASTSPTFPGDLQQSWYKPSFLLWMVVCYGFIWCISAQCIVCWSFFCRMIVVWFAKTDILWAGASSRQTHWINYIIPMTHIYNVSICRKDRCRYNVVSTFS